jgi:hypothetical protein
VKMTPMLRNTTSHFSAWRRSASVAGQTGALAPK